MTDYTIVNLRNDVADQAPNSGYAPHMEARFASELETRDAPRLVGGLSA